jgi:RimJ/RimL family protein N-acetyltransferase
MQKLAVFSWTVDPTVKPESVGLRMRWLDEDEVWASFDVLAQDYERDWLERRLAAGGRLAVAELDGRIVGWNIYQLGESDQLDWLKVVLPADAVMALGGFVVPAFRGRRILAAIKRFAGRWYCSHGVRRMISIVEPANVPSMNAHRNVGAAEVMTIARGAFAGVEVIRVRRKWAIGRDRRDRRFILRIE